MIHFLDVLTDCGVLNVPVSSLLHLAGIFSRFISHVRLM